MAEKTIVRVSRKQAKDLFNTLGWKNNDTWPNTQFAERMSGIPDVAPEDKNWKPEDEAVAKVYLDVMAGIEAKADFEVYDDEESKAEAEAAKAKKAEEKAAKKEQKAEVSEEAKAAKAKAKEEAKAAKKVEREKAKAERQAARAEKKAAKKVREEVRGRGFYAGQVFAKHGIQNGITDEMIAEVDSMYGTPNPVVSKGALKWAYDALRGYGIANGMPVGAEAKQEAAV